jgi:pyruvate dehydrogenase E2 component (dihydrolipoyllysine-residue acetyltransferase)
MTTKVIMPQMGESIFEGTITKWLKKVGDNVARDEPLFEISTDKIDSEIPSPAAGVLSEILIPEGKTVQINTVVAVIDGEGTGQAKAEEEGAGDKREPGPSLETETAGEAPSRVEEGEKPLTPKQEVRAETPPAEQPKSAPPAAPPPLKPAPAPAPPPKPAPPAAPPARDIRTSPLVRKLAREHGIDLSQIQGTGLEGRITKQDILSYVDQQAEVEEAPKPRLAEVPKTAPTPAIPPEKEAPQPAPAIPEAPKFAVESETVPMTPMRKAIAEHMMLSRRTSAHVSTVFEVDMTSIVQLREKHKESFEAREGIKLTYTPFLVKALVDTVREFPILNCSVSGDNIVYKREVNVGIAVALDTGLIVPVVKHAHLKSLTGLAVAIHDLAERARTKKLKPEEVQNGTITVTNPGIYGALFGTPIINQPQVAILGVGGIQKRPVVINDAIAIRSMVYLSLSFDHRVIDGAVADQAMASLKSKLESWTQWAP